MGNETKPKTCLLIIFFLLVICSATFAGQIIYVDSDANGLNNGSSWTDAVNSLQDALLAAHFSNEPVEIRVAQGIYTPDTGIGITQGDLNVSFQLINNVTLRGSYAGIKFRNPDARNIELYETILSGDLDSNDIDVNDRLEEMWWTEDSFQGEPNREDNSYHVINGSGTDDSAVLDGFTITGGYARYPSSENGGGIYIDTGNPTVTNCTFRRNSSRWNGGGMSCKNNSHPTLTNCTFTLNYAFDGGAMYNNSSNPTLTNCTFIDNTTAYPAGVIVERAQESGGGMYNYLSNPILTNCIFRRNSTTFGGGIYNRESNPELTNCIFQKNSGYYCSGIHNNSSNPALTNCIFSDNSTDSGSTISGGSPIITNCTITGNQSVDGAGGISGGNPTITNCIIWGNTPPQIISDATISFSNIQGRWPGEGNIDADPLFIDSNGADNVLGTEDDDLRLITGSPCIDAGDNSAVPPLVDTDIKGNRRIINDVVDMGAYESPLPVISLSTNELVVPEGDTATFTISLIDAPLQRLEVIITHYSGDSDITVESGEILIFDASNYSAPQTVTIAAAEDSDNQNSTAQIRITTTNGLFEVITITEADNEPDVGILFVDSDAVGDNNGSNWMDAYIYLQDALSAASESVGVEEIRVARGVYQPDHGGGNIPGDREATFNLINGVSIKGGFAGANGIDPDERDFITYETILSGDLNSDDIEIANPCDLWDEPTRSDNSYHVITSIGIDETTSIDGFTITGGNNNIDPHYHGGGVYNLYGKPCIANCTFIKNSAFFGGGGMYNSNGNPSLTNCTFDTNYAQRYGGGMYNSRSNPILTNCIFKNNNAYHYGGGGMYNSASNPTLYNCEFIANSANGYFGEGGGMRNYLSNPMITNCLFAGNLANDGYDARGGGIHNDGRSGIGSNPILTNCTFIDNLARDGGGIFNLRSSYQILTNCIFCGNTADNCGGGIYNWGSTSVLTNCTFTQNAAQNGITLASKVSWILEPSNVELTNCILWERGSEIWWDDNYSTITVSYSNIRGGWSGEGGHNISVDPLFANPESGEYHLKSQAGRFDPNSESWVIDQTSSPCIDAGDPNSSVGDEPEPNGGRINMGAYGGTVEASMSLSTSD